MTNNSKRDLNGKKVRYLWPALFLILALSLFSCSPKFRVQSTAPNKGNFSSYKTFKFYNPANLSSSNFSFSEGDQKIIFDAIAEELKARGYISRQDADLIIKVQGGTNMSMDIRNDPWGGPVMYDPMFYNYGRYGHLNNRPRTESKKETSLIIDIIDVKDDKIVWHGVGIGTLSRKENMTGLALKDAVNNIFIEYPYQAPQ